MEDKTSTMGRRTFLKTAAASYTVSVHVPQMYHCRRCRADAVGLLCADGPSSERSLM